MTLTVLKLGCDELSRLGVTRFTRKSNRSMCFDQGFIRVGGEGGYPPSQVSLPLALIKFLMIGHEKWVCPARKGWKKHSPTQKKNPVWRAELWVWDWQPLDPCCCMHLIQVRLLVAFCRGFNDRGCIMHHVFDFQCIKLISLSTFPAMRWYVNK